MKQLYRSKFDRQLMGVCGGIAEYFNIDSSIVRVIFAFLCMIAFSGIIFYIICSVIIPEYPFDTYLIDKERKRLKKSRIDRKISGVCGGIAEYLEINSLLVRLAWIAMVLFLGTGILVYFVLAICLPES